MEDGHEQSYDVQEIDLSINSTTDVLDVVKDDKLAKYEGQKWKGYVCYFIFTLFNVGVYIVAKFLYIAYPELDPYQLVFIRSVFSLFYLSLMTNIQAKRIFYDEWDNKYLVPMIFRSFQSAVSSIINMIAVLHIDVVIVSLVNNTTPVFVCLLAMCFLNERLRLIEILFMTGTFACVILIIAGQGESSSGSDTLREAPWAYLSLFCNPLLSAAGQIAQKKLTALDERVVTFWPQLMTAIITLIYIFIYESKWDTLEDMAWWGWVLMALNGSLVICQQIARFVALRYESASSLQKMAFLTAIYSFVFDITLFGVSFSPLQLAGLISALLIYILQLYYFVREHKKEAEKVMNETMEVLYE